MTQDPTQPDEPQEPPKRTIIVPPSQQAGVWANFVLVSHTEYEFTLDFVRWDSLGVPNGVVVARVSMSPLLVTQLQEALDANWEEFAEKALPKEVFEDGQEGSEGGEPPAP